MKHTKVHGNLTVQGNKVIPAQSLMNDEGFFTDKLGNTIYFTDSKENKDRLKNLKTVTKKVTKRGRPRKKTTKEG